MSFHVYACLITPNVMSFVEPNDHTACNKQQNTEEWKSGFMYFPMLNCLVILVYIPSTYKTFIVKIYAVTHCALSNILCLWCLWIVSRPCDLRLAWHSDFYKCVLIFIELQNHLLIYFWRSTSVCMLVCSLFYIFWNCD